MARSVAAGSPGSGPQSALSGGFVGDRQMPGVSRKQVSGHGTGLLSNRLKTGTAPFLVMRSGR